MFAAVVRNFVFHLEFVYVVKAAGHWGNFAGLLSPRPSCFPNRLFPQAASPPLNTIQTDSAPTRQRFEQIRAQWETAPSPPHTPSKMVGRKEKQKAKQAAIPSDNANTGSKIRRTFSQGLSFISNPLGQRKVTPGRQPLPSSSVTTPEPTVVGSDTETGKSDQAGRSTHSTLVFEDSQSSLLRCRTPPSNHLSAETINLDATPTNKLLSAETIDLDATPKPLPHSQTMSFIPRPSRSNSITSIVDTSTARKPRRTSALPHPTTSQIPTPSPPVPSRRVVSPRQYIPRYSSTQAKHIAASMAFAGIAESSTTPNLAKRTSQPQSQHFAAASRRSILKNSILQENIPTHNRDSRNFSQTSEAGLKRESMLAASNRSMEHPFAPRNPFDQDTKYKFATAFPPDGSESSRNVSLPTVKAPWQKQQAEIQSSQSARDLNRLSIAQPRLMGPVEPSNPSVGFKSGRPELPRASTDRNLRRRPLAVPAALAAGSSIYARPVATPANQVRLPRSPSCRDLAAKALDAIPPVPPIPERFKTASVPNLAKPRMAAPHTFPKSVPESKSCRTLKGKSRKEVESPSERALLLRQANRRALRLGSWYPYEASKSRNSIEDPFYDTPTPDLEPQGSEIALLGSSVSVNTYGHEANTVIDEQVKKYMPSAYWGGRFQTLSDQWQTEVMKADCLPNHEPEGQLGRFGMEQHMAAVDHIFSRLRASCLSKAAKESLWEFEYQYRQQHRLLDPAFDPASSSAIYHKQTSYSASTQGTFGRAVRKLTPRKSSFVNLLKGKGWGKGDEAKTSDLDGYTQLHPDDE